MGRCSTVQGSILVRSGLGARIADPISSIRAPRFRLLIYCYLRAARCRLDTSAASEVRVHEIDRPLFL